MSGGRDPRVRGVTRRRMRRGLSQRKIARDRSPSEYVVGIARRRRPDGSRTWPGELMDPQPRPVEVRRTVVARCAIHVPEVRARLGDLQVGVPPPSTEQCGGSQLAHSRTLGEHARPRVPLRGPSVVRCRPVCVMPERPARGGFPGTLEPGRLILAERRIRGSHQRRDRESARPPRLHQGEPGPDRVVERSLHVAGDDRVPFLRRGAHRPRSIGATLDSGARRRSGSFDPAASRARARAGDDPRGVRRQERPVRRNPRRARDVRLSAGRAVRLYAAAVRMVPRRSLPAVRPVVARGRARPDRRRCRHGTARPRDRRAAALPGVGLVAALLTTLHPYLVWHDVHANREVLDGLVLALLVLCALLAYENRSLTMAAATGCVTGLAILGNTRLVLLPVAIGFFVAGRVPVARTLAAAALVIVGAALVVAPWVALNKVEVGCYAITTDARALWKANNPATRGVLDRGDGSTTFRSCRESPLAELAADLTLAGTPTSVDECAQMRLYRGEVLEFWRENPGEKAWLAAQATRMLWNPIPSESDAIGSGVPGRRGARSNRRSWSVSTSWRSRASSSLPDTSSHWRSCCSPTTRSPRSCSANARYRAPWDSCSLSSPRSHSQRSGSASEGDARGYTAAALRAR